jgi:hypothetical protein
MINTKPIVIIDDVGDVFKFTNQIFAKEKEYEFIISTSKKEDVNEALEEIPCLIIVNGDGLQKDVLKLC